MFVVTATGFFLKKTGRMALFILIYLNIQCFKYKIWAKKSFEYEQIVKSVTRYLKFKKRSQYEFELSG